MQARLLLSPTERSRFILSTLKHLCRERRFRHQWRTANHLATLCHKWFTIPEPLQFDGNDLNNALLKDPALKLDMKAEKSVPNQFGIYHDTYRPRRDDANRRVAHCYYLCDPDGKECINSPPVGKVWYDTIPSIPELQKECEALVRSTRTLRELPHDAIDIVSRARYLAEERPTKRTHLGEDADNVSTRLSSPGPSTETSKSLPLEVVVKSEEPAQALYLAYAYKEDKYGTKDRSSDFTKEALMRKLTEKGIEATGNAKQIQAMCVAQNIPTKYIEKEIKEGWEGKAKGMEQVLWERGWIDETRPRKDYTKLGTKDSLGLIQVGMSLLELVSNCADFENEATLLQTKGQEMGVLVDRTPKCHCELAGEGIEYSWGCTKNLYWRQPLKMKRGKANFRATVRKCFSRDIITIERVRLFSQRARAYMLAYQMLQEEEQGLALSLTGMDVKSTSCPVKVEKILKKFKTHRCAMDFDKAFCKKIFTKSDE